MPCGSHQSTVAPVSIAPRRALKSVALEGNACQLWPGVEGRGASSLGCRSDRSSRSLQGPGSSLLPLGLHPGRGGGQPLFSQRGWPGPLTPPLLSVQHKQGKVGPDGKELIPQESPRVGGFGFIATPSPAPGEKHTRWWDGLGGGGLPGWPDTPGAPLGLHCASCDSGPGSHLCQGRTGLWVAGLSGRPDLGRVGPAGLAGWFLWLTLSSAGQTGLVSRRRGSGGRPVSPVGAGQASFLKILFIYLFIYPFI